jgi:uncharacterized protein YqjF (DUF2071 family)
MRQVDCTIERRLLVNYRIDPGVLDSLLPDGIRPQIVRGAAVGGVCFLRLSHLRPGALPSWFGLRTENVAHRFAVEWEGDNGVVAGVYVPRRETDSRLAAWSGGRLFPGVYRFAQFEVEEHGGDYRIDAQSADGSAHVAVRARRTDQLTGSLFEDVADAVEFFRSAPTSLSPNESGSCLEGVTLQCDQWAVEPLVIHEMRSVVFDDAALFPPGTCSLDSALVMHDLDSQFVVDEHHRMLDSDGAPPSMVAAR